MRRILVYGMTSNKGGIESYLMNYFRVLSEYEIIFDFITESSNMAYSEEVKALGGDIFCIPSRREGLLKHMKRIRYILKSHPEYDTVYFNILSASEVFTVLSTIGLKKIRRIVHSHNNAVKTMERHKLLRPLLRCLTTDALACSDEAAEFMFGESWIKRHPVKIIKNAISIDKYLFNEQVRNDVRIELEIPEEAYVIGHVGRMCYQKNTLFIIEVFKYICAMDDKAFLLLVGDGEDRKIVEQAVEESGVKSRIKILGMRNDVERLIQGMDVFFLPSRFEGLPVVAIEAQASGLPCVFSDRFSRKADVTGNAEFISLDSEIDKWSNATLKYKDFKRKDEKKSIQEAGYDISREADSLMHFFEGDGYEKK